MFFFLKVLLCVIINYCQKYYVSNSGRDDNGCGSSSNPCLTLGYIIANYKNVNDVVFLNGIYLWEIFTPPINFVLEGESTSGTIAYTNSSIVSQYEYTLEWKTTTFTVYNNATNYYVYFEIKSARKDTILAFSSCTFDYAADVILSNPIFHLIDGGLVSFTRCTIQNYQLQNSFLLGYDIEGLVVNNSEIKNINQGALDNATLVSAALFNITIPNDGRIIGIYNSFIHDGRGTNGPVVLALEIRGLIPPYCSKAEIFFTNVTNVSSTSVVGGGASYMVTANKVGYNNNNNNNNNNNKEKNNNLLSSNPEYDCLRPESPHALRNMPPPTSVNFTGGNITLSVWLGKGGFGGGAIGLSGINGHVVFMIFTACGTYARNVGGGCIAFEGSGDPSDSDMNIFVYNTAFDNSYVSSDSNDTIPWGGGVLYFSGYLTNITIQLCMVQDAYLTYNGTNAKVGLLGFGGGIFFTYAHPVIVMDTMFLRVRTSGGPGSAIYDGEEISVNGSVINYIEKENNNNNNVNSFNYNTTIIVNCCASPTVVSPYIYLGGDDPNDDVKYDTLFYECSAP